MTETANYRCRGDFVLFRIIDRGIHRGIAMPNIAAQGKDKVVIAIGPKVEDLKVGDKVLVIGQPGQDVVQVPTEPNLFLSREANIVLVEVESEA